jgi:hypothetical protein
LPVDWIDEGSPTSTSIKNQTLLDSQTNHIYSSSLLVLSMRSLTLIAFITYSTSLPILTVWKTKLIGQLIRRDF